MHPNNAHPTGIPDHDHRSKVAELTRCVMHSLGAWSGLFRPDAIRGLAFVVAESAPSLPDRELVTLTRLGAWICAFDDMVDDTTLSDQDLATRIEQYEDLICHRDCPELAFDPLALVLGQVLAELWSAPLGRTLWPLFATQLLASCNAMKWERLAFKRRDERPTVEAYLDQASASICVSFVITAAAMLLGETAIVAHVPSLLAAERHAATAIRIANDLATWTREQNEELAVNALALGTDACALRRRCEQEMRRLEPRITSLRAGVPLTAMFLEQFTATLVAIYARGDLSEVVAD